MLLRCRISLAHFDLDVDVAFDARVTSIFGPSGSGKTTLLDAIAGLRNIMAGEIEFNGRTLFSSSQKNRYSAPGTGNRLCSPRGSALSTFFRP